MKLNIIYNNKNIPIHIHKYSSINSLISLFNTNIDDYYADYNGIYLDKNYSLDKYDIKENSILKINQKIKGGNKLVNSIKKHKGYSLLILLIVLIPVFLLPNGYLPALSSFFKVIIDKSVGSISRFLICEYGFETLVSRFYFLISIIKFFIFIILIYVTITLPITILFIFINGSEIFDNPKLLCKPVKYGGIAGLAITSIYIFIYAIYRSGNKIFNFIIDNTKNIQSLSFTLTPVVTHLRDSFNNNKYSASGLLISDAMNIKFLYFDNWSKMVQTTLLSYVNIGCEFNTNKVKNNLSKYIKSNTDKIIKEDNINYPQCNENKSMECCSEKNFEKMADILLHDYIEKNDKRDLLIDKNLLSPAIILTTSLYEKALELYKISLKNYENSNNEEKNTNILNKFKDTIEKIKENLIKLEEEMKKYLPSYSKGGFIENLLKKVYVASFCNVANSSYSAQEVIKECNGMNEIIDIIKAGKVAGNASSYIYFLVVIIIIICSVLGIF
jgi:hypothetical protein